MASDHDEAVVVDRVAFDRELAEQAAGAGAEIVAGHRVTALLRSDNGLTAHTVGHDGVTRSAR